MTITNPSLIPVSVDYTGRDYYALREEMIARIQERLPDWTASNPSDFGVALVEAFAYMGDLMSYYIDRVANESFIATATQRDSIYNLANSYGYTPAGYRAATVDLKFTNSSEDSIEIPAGTVVYGDVVSGDTVQQVYFTTTETVTADPEVDNGIVFASASHGQSVVLVSTEANSFGEYVGASDGSPNQVFQLGETPVVDGSISVYVEEGNSYSSWSQVQHILDYGPNSQVFSSYSDANNNVFIQLGNGVSGLIPVNLSEVRAKYTVGGGELGNVLSDVLTNIEYVPGLNTNDFAAFVSNIEVTNVDVATGGSDPESLEVTRYLAPLYLRANSRAVTLDDFNSLALGVSGVGKANSVAGTNWTSVTTYIAPSRNSSDNDLQPGLDDNGDPTIEYTNLATAVEEALTPNMLIGTTLSIQPPTYADIILGVQYKVNPQYSISEVEAAIKAQIVSEYGFVNVTFGQTIYQQEIEYALNNLSQVKIAKVNVLHRQGDTGVQVLEAEPSEIFRFQEANISLSTF